MARLTVAAELEGRVRVGALVCTVSPSDAGTQALAQVLDDAVAAVRRNDAPDVSAARDLYKAIRLDPTRTRPSSEALLRRVRRGDPLPRVNVVVDIGNWCSLEFQLPYGVYDARRVQPPVTLRVGGPGDGYAGIRKDHVSLDGRFALFDHDGPFGNPSSDSARTMVTDATREVFVVVYAPARVEAARVAAVLDRTAERLQAYAGGCVTDRQVV